MSDLEPIGPISALQLKKEPLVRGVRPQRTYHTDALVQVPAMVLTGQGAMARIDGGWVLDRHHAAHPANGSHRPDRALSVGFTGHYGRIRERFGWGPLGVGGENIIVDTPERITIDDVSAGLVIRTAGGDIPLDGPKIAAPCVPFTRHLLQNPEAPLDEVEAPRAFLHDGIRGYVVGLESVAEPVEINVGDLVLRRR